MLKTEGGTLTNLSHGSYEFGNISNYGPCEDLPLWVDPLPATAVACPEFLLPSWGGGQIIKAIKTASLLFGLQMDWLPFCSGVQTPP